MSNRTVLISRWRIVAAALLAGGVILGLTLRASTRAERIEAKAVAIEPAAAEFLARPAASAGQGRLEQVETEIITATPSGFSPTEITRPRGRFVLMVDNLSELAELDLKITREVGGGVHQVNVPSHQASWNDVFDLPPGSYVLTEANRPEWACRITITPQ